MKHNFKIGDYVKGPDSIGDIIEGRIISFPMSTVCYIKMQYSNSQYPAGTNYSMFIPHLEYGYRHKNIEKVNKYLGIK